MSSAVPAPMSLKEFAEELAERSEFRHVTTAKCREVRNAVLVGGNVVGDGAMDELSRIGRRHGFLVLADRISVWHTRQDFERYGKSKPEEGGKA
jgi:hypothetical protein